MHTTKYTSTGEVDYHLIKSYAKCLGVCGLFAEEGEFGGVYSPAECPVCGSTKVSITAEYRVAPDGNDYIGDFVPVEPRPLI